MGGDLSRTETQTRRGESRAIPGAPPLARRVPNEWERVRTPPTTPRREAGRVPFDRWQPARRGWQTCDVPVTRWQHPRGPAGRGSVKSKLALGPVSRILFLPLARDSVVISLKPILRWACHVGVPLARDEDGCGIPAAMGRAVQPPILPCTGRGFSCRPACAKRGGLLPHLFTLTARLPARRFVFCDTVRRRALKRNARTCGEARAASCPAVSGLSSPAVRRARRYPRLGIKERWSDDQAPKPRPPPKAVEGPRSNEP